MKILIDLNLSPSWVQFFADHKIEAVHWSHVGSVSAADSEILAYAAARNLIVFTHDLDFGALLAASRQNAPSVLQIRTQDVLPATLGPVLLRILETCRHHLESGALVTVEAGQNRIRMLPIR